MQSNKATGLALIVGVLTLIAGIAIHPHHGSAAPSGDMARQNLTVIVVVLTGFGILSVGFLRLLRLTAPQLSNDVAFIALTVAVVCSSLAGIIGHLLIPRLMDQLNASDKADPAIVHAVVANDSIFSVALVQTSLAAWAIGVLALSISMLRSTSGWKVVGACGIALGLFILLALTLGWLQISLHNIGLVVLGSGIWVIAIGVGLCTNKSSAALAPQ